MKLVLITKYLAMNLFEFENFSRNAYFIYRILINLTENQFLYFIKENNALH